MRYDLLDDRLEWPLAERREGAPWRLGHGLTVVGPGWWPLVRRAFAHAAETPGATVRRVRQKCAVLEVWFAHPAPLARAQLDAFSARIRRASRSRCEACGAAVLPPPPAAPPSRNHCSRCADRLRDLALAGRRGAEIALWEERAGGPWPPRVW